jgi:hypothetical protein
MDIKKLVRKILSEQPDDEVAPIPQPQLTRLQRDFLSNLTTKWREEYPKLTDEVALETYLAYRKALPSIQNPKNYAVAGFILRGKGRYTFNDLKDISNVRLNDLVVFLLDYSNVRINLGDDLDDEEKEKRKLDAIFNESPPEKGKGGITPQKIELSKTMWEGNFNIIVDEDNFRVYEVNTRQQSNRMGYYYQEKLRELVTYNVDNNRPKTSISPWCLVGRSTDQTVYYKGRSIINGVGNAYTGYRSDNSLYFVIDESKDLFGYQGEYYIGVVLAGRDGKYQLASMYNGEYNISPEDLYKIYPKLRGKLDLLKYNTYDMNAETNDGTPLNIVDRMNETEGSDLAFWLQGPDEKSQYINAGRYLKNPKSWETMSDDLRTLYITNINRESALARVSTDEFMRAIVKSGNVWKGRLDYKLKQLNFAGIGYLAENFMKREFAPDFIGKKNSYIKIYKSKTTNKYGIYDLNNVSWIEKDGISYEPEFIKHVLMAPEGDLIDNETDKFYTVCEFISPSNKFYTLSDIDDEDFVVYILSEKKYQELRQKIDDQQGGIDDENDIDIAEVEK